MTGDALKNPEHLRQNIIARRRSQNPDEALRLGQAATGRWLDACRGAGVGFTGRRVALYRAFAGELDLSPLELALEQSGARLHYPCIAERKNSLMELVAASPREAATWPRNSYGIEEPPPGWKAVDPSGLDLIFVPGVAFGPGGERLGMGAGYYDRFLPRASRALRVAVTFDFQLTGAFAQESWDQPVHWVMTEVREVRSARAQAWLATGGKTG